MMYLNLHACFHVLSSLAPYNLICFLIFHRINVLKKRKAEHRVDLGFLVYVHVGDDIKKIEKAL
jgi:hypothetical protein